MALESFLSKFSQEKKETPEKFLALEISANSIKSALWQIKEDKIQLISFGSVEKWDGQDLDELVVLADSSIAKAVELQEEEPNKVLFGLPETWVSGEKIAKPRLKDLRELSSKLDLKPLGFVVTTEAVIAYLKILEGVPLNAILARLLEKEATVSLVKAGKLLGTQVVGRSEELGADVYEALSRFSEKENLPPRILVFNTESSLEKEEQSLISFNWGRLFLHFPRVEILDEEFSIKAIVMAGGWEVAKVKGLTPKAPELEPQKTTSLVQKVEEEVKEEKGSDLGFVIDKDIRLEKEISQEVPFEKPIVAEKENIPQVKKRKLPLFRVNLTFFKNFLVSFLTLPQKIISRLSLKGSSYFVPLLTIIFVGLLLGSAFALYWYLPTAKITLFVNPKNFSREIEVTVDPISATIDYEKYILPGETIKETVSQSQEAATTGEKIVGDKAKGEVIIYNKTYKSKSLSKETALVDPGNLKFLTAEEIEIASASAEEREGGQLITWGKKNVAVIAEEIGPEYNFSFGTEFTLQGLSTDAFMAKNEADFSGGSSRKVKIVSSKDQENLFQALSESLKKEAAENLGKKISSDLQFFKEGIRIETVKKEFDKKVESEAENLRLDLEVKAETLAFRRQDLKELLLRQIKDALPQGYELEESETEARIEESELEEGKAKFKGIVEAKLIPHFEIEKIKEEIKGKYPYVTQDYFENLPSFKRVEIEIKPVFLPAKLKTFPRQTKNIKIEVKILE